MFPEVIPRKTASHHTASRTYKYPNSTNRIPARNGPFRLPSPTNTQQLVTNSNSYEQFEFEPAVFPAKCNLVFWKIENRKNHDFHCLPGKMNSSDGCRVQCTLYVWSPLTPRSFCIGPENKSKVKSHAQRTKDGKCRTVPSANSFKHDPKSARRMWPFASRTTLSGLMSRCTYRR